MNLQIRSVNIASETWKNLERWMQQQLQGLSATKKIERAWFQLEHVGHGSPSYHVQVHLETPGPDLRTESRDHTLRAAIVKAFHQLKRQISDRCLNRTRQSNHHACRRRSK